MELDKSKNNKEKKLLDPIMRDMIIGASIAIIGLIIFAIGLFGINIFPPILNYILGIIILICGAGYAYYRHQNPPLTQEQQLVTAPITVLQQQLSDHKNQYQLNQYVATLLHRGKKEQEIKNLCKTAGWNEKEIKEAFEKSQKDKKDPNKQIEEYIKIQLAKGRPLNEIQTTLQKAGWKKEIIETLIKKNLPNKK